MAVFRAPGPASPAFGLQQLSPQIPRELLPTTPCETVHVRPILAGSYTTSVSTAAGPTTQCQAAGRPHPALQKHELHLGVAPPNQRAARSPVRRLLVTRRSAGYDPGARPTILTTRISCRGCSRGGLFAVIDQCLYTGAATRQTPQADARSLKQRIQLRDDDRASYDKSLLGTLSAAAGPVATA